MPGGGNPQAYDRYSYVNNNPVNSVDPSGHSPCEDDTCRGGKHYYDVGLLYQTAAKKEFNWYVNNDISLEQSREIFIAGWQIYQREFAVGNDPKAWMAENIGNTYFTYSSAASVIGRPWVFMNIVNLPSKYNPDNLSAFWMLHEVAHVIDNHLSHSGKGSILGDGPSSDLMKYLGGRYSSRMYGLDDHSTDKNYLSNPDFLKGLPSSSVRWPININYASYGNNNIADYYAHTFAFGMTNPSAVPESARNWFFANLLVSPAQFNNHPR